MDCGWDVSTSNRTWKRRDEPIMRIASVCGVRTNLVLRRELEQERRVAVRRQQGPLLPLLAVLLLCDELVKRARVLKELARERAAQCALVAARYTASA